jgi:hypothetical protein
MIKLLFDEFSLIPSLSEMNQKKLSNLSFLNLHLQSRLHIAELNANINLLRIYHDYLEELKSKNGDAEVNNEVIRFERLFPVLREEIDSLRNELHLLKMKFATYSREDKVFDTSIYSSTGFDILQKKYNDFQKSFEKTKKELDNFEKSKV